MKKKVERRQEEITQLVLQNKQISVKKLAQQLSVTQETIRRDLTILEDKGILYRTHGGAVVRDTYMDIPMEYRIQENHDVKKDICREILRYIRNGSSIFVDPSSTVLPLGKLLNHRKNVLIVTNCLEFAEAAQASKNRIILLGGTYSHSGRRTEGHFAYDMLQKFMFDVALLGMDGCFGMDGPGTLTEDAIALNRHVIERAQKKILMGTAEKFERKTKFQYAKFSEFDQVIAEYFPEKLRDMISPEKLTEIYGNDRIRKTTGGGSK